MPRILLIIITGLSLIIILIIQLFFSVDHLVINQPSTFHYAEEIIALKKKVLFLEHNLYIEGIKRNVSEETIQSLRKRLNNLGSYDGYVIQKIHNSEIIDGLQMKTEYDIPPFNRFTLNRIYVVDPGLGKRVVEKPIAFKKKDLHEIVKVSLQRLNGERSNETGSYTMEHFLEGIYRTTPGIGSQYELYFRHLDRDGKRTASIDKIALVRPFAPPVIVRHQVQATNEDLINIIMPLSGRRASKFKTFMSRFINVCIKTGVRVFLTVVYFGEEAFDDIKDTMMSVSKKYSYSSMKLLSVRERFSRGRGLQIGALNWSGPDVLMFFCDVDIVFGLEFLERCRLNTERSRRVYYPIVFSLYNPNVVYKLNGIKIPPENEQLVISKETGFWRDFGYGMTCQYKSDFMRIKGFEQNMSEWGGEDVFLYQKYVKSKYMLIRVTDPGIFHLWHEKVCEKNMTADKYSSCIRSKALNEASHAQLGLLAFRDEIHRRSEIT